MTTTYAILGATGNTGTSLIKVLLAQHPEAHIHAYCRNKTKLFRLLPDAADDKRMVVFEGDMLDVELLANCVRGTKAIFHAVSTNTNIPNLSVGQDSCAALVQALEQIKAADADAVIPRLVLLSSCSGTDALCTNLNGVFRSLLRMSESNIYGDLAKAEALLRSREDLVKTVYIKPGGLSLDVQSGHQLVTDRQETFISYLTLAGGMVEAADAPDGVWDGRDVSVVHKVPGHSAKFPISTPLTIFWGLIRHLFPWMHEYLPYAP
jgi:putative NADH-flavin reductase